MNRGAILPMEWEPVIGLEIHVELNTQSKLFSSAPNHFGDEPNTNITEVCTGQPGALPVLNKEAVRKAVFFGCAINAEISRYSRFDRKSYFYPDSPRNFQITQFEMPLIIGGQIVADVEGVEKTFSIAKAHLEDDAGMLKHFTHFAGIDYNRAGVPLIEIVSEPCIHSSKQAIAYAMALKAMIEYLDISDCNMEEGSLRFDANISVRPKGEQTLRNKIEIKNMNSFSFMGMAIDAEIKRQIHAYTVEPEKDPTLVIKQATYRWDPEKKETVLMRKKESSDDYRYFLEPDLPPLVLEDEYIDSIRNQLPELPFQKQKRFIDQFGLSKDAAFQLVGEKALADYFEEGLSYCTNPKALSNWILVEFTGRLKERGLSITKSQITAASIGQLIALIDAGRITGKMAKQVADEMLAKPHLKPQEIVESNPNFNPVEDTAALEEIVIKVMLEQASSVEDYRKGKERAFGFLVGQVMKATGGRASPAIVNEILKRKLNQ